MRGWQEDSRTLALYLLTNEQRSAEGFYGLPLGLMADDLQWTPDRLRGALTVVESDGFALYDEAARVVLIRKALKYGKPRGGPSIKGAINVLKGVRGTTEQFGLFLEAADKYAPAFAAAIRLEYTLPKGPYVGG